MEKFVQELAWRDFWQKQWQHHGASINQDLKHVQQDVNAHGVPQAIIKAKTGIQAIDKAILDLYETGYMHNHMRMYLASVICNVGHFHWRIPAQWMFSHLIDGDWASNALSWQWVAGSNANKKYWANQDNINHFCSTDQWGTFLDHSYEDLPNQPIPSTLTDYSTNPTADFGTPADDLTGNSTLVPSQDQNQAVCLYTPYNLDPNWHADTQANRILLLDPNYIKHYPTSSKVIRFIKDLAFENIPDIKMFIGSFEALKKEFPQSTFYAKEHPELNYAVDVIDQRDWLAAEAPYKPSFFPYWKKCLKSLKHDL
jgi:deoxyribodipyrimidine photo-lyase